MQISQGSLTLSLSKGNTERHFEQILINIFTTVSFQKLLKCSFLFKLKPYIKMLIKLSSFIKREFLV